MHRWYLKQEGFCWVIFREWRMYFQFFVQLEQQENLVLSRVELYVKELYWLYFNHLNGGLNARFVNLSHILVLPIWKENLVKGLWSPWRIILVELSQPMKNLLSIKSQWENTKVVANFLLKYWVFSMRSSLYFQQNQQIFCQQMLHMFAQRKKERVKSTANIFCFITSFLLLQSEQS